MNVIKLKNKKVPATVNVLNIYTVQVDIKRTDAHNTRLANPNPDSVKTTLETYGQKAFPINAE